MPRIKCAPLDPAHQDIESALHSADLDAEFALQFQPIVHLGSGRVAGLEALARWRSPRLGLIPPDIFIPLAERAGTITSLTLVLLKKAFTAASFWPDNVKLHVNISALEISSITLMRQVLTLLLTANLNPQRVNFEITETTRIYDIDVARFCINELTSLGCGVSLDDFGVGYSSLAHLQSLPVTSIKLDRSFTAKIHENKTVFNIVKSIIRLSRDIEIECIVEGVESRNDLDLLRSIGCTEAQGFYFSRPLAQADALKLVGKASAWPQDKIYKYCLCNELQADPGGQRKTLPKIVEA